MKKQIAVLVLGLLLIVGSLYAADGDLIVNGKLGIGTTNLVSKITVSGGSANWNETTPGLATGSFHLNPGNASDHFGSAITFGASDAGNGENAQAGIYTRSDTTYGTKMYFSTTNTYTTGSKTRMIIDHAGNVGIGTTLPTVKLDINGQLNMQDSGAKSFSGGLVSEAGAQLINFGINEGIYNRFGGTYVPSAQGGMLRVETRSGIPLFQFWGRQAGVSADASPLMAVLSNGNVGIGTASPLRTLDVGTNGQMTFGNNGYSSTGSPGIFWYVDNTNYGIYKTAGSWSAPNYQQLALKWDPGIVIDGGSAYGKSGIALQPNGGKVGIGTTNPAGKLELRISAGEPIKEGIAVLNLNGFGGNDSIGVKGYASGFDFYAAGPGVDYGTASSIRWKRNIVPITDALAKVKGIRGIYFDWDEEHGGQHAIGFIGEEVAKQVPEIVVFDDNDKNYIAGMDYSKMTPLLLEAIKEQQKQIELLKAEVEELQKKKE